MKKGEPFEMRLILIKSWISLILAFSISGAITPGSVNHGSDTSLDQINTGTLYMWVYPTTLSNNIRLTYKSGGAGALRTFIHTGSGEMIHQIQGGTHQTKVTNTGTLTNAEWQFFAVAYQFGTTNGGIYRGTLTTPASIVTLATNTAGATAGNDSSGSLFVGSNDSAAQVWTGRIAWMMWVSGTLHTLEQIQSIQYRPRPVTGCVLFVHYDGNATQANLCGPGAANNGTNTGGTVSDHVPIGGWFARTLQWFLDRSYAHLPAYSQIWRIQ